MSDSLARARALFNSGRYASARDEASTAVAEDPDEVEAYALLALSFSKLKDHRNALDTARKAVAVDPDWSYPQYILGVVALNAGKLADAQRAAVAALNLDSGQAHHYALLARIRFNQTQWKDCLALCDEGLRIDPDDEDCLTVRGLVLPKLGRNADAIDTLKRTIAQDPDDSHSHAAQGWAMLHAKRYDEALTHFKEALRINPTSEYAREGLLQSLRARHRVYRLFLTYFLWLGKLNGSVRSAFTLGTYVVARALIMISNRNPTLAPYLLPIGAAYFVFVILFWMSVPLFNLTLRLHPLGKLALTQTERMESSVFGMGLGIAMIYAIVGAITHHFFFYAGGALILFFTILQCLTSRVDSDRRRKAYAGILGTLIVLMAIVFGLLGIAPNPSSKELGGEASAYLEPLGLSRFVRLLAAE